MNDKERTELSRFLCLILRHKPETVGITLDQNGWVDVDVLVDAMNQKGQHFTREILDKIVATDDKQRYAFSPDKKRIRASQGHSIAVDLELTPVAPPEFLYHGTAERFVSQITHEGLKPRERQYVHLSVAVATAIAVGSRHGKPVVLTVLAQKMHAAGQAFFLSENSVWMTTHVEPEFLEVMETEP